jgi:adenylosuccinate lyase
MLFRLVKARASAVLDYVHCEWEDDHRQGETPWSFAPEISLLVGAQIEMLSRILETLIVKPQNMLRNLDRTNGSVLSEALLMALAPKMGRDAAHAHVLILSRQAQSECRAFADIVRRDAKVRSIVSPPALEKALDYRNGIGLSTYFVDAVLRQRPRDKRSKGASKR